MIELWVLEIVLVMLFFPGCPALLRAKTREIIVNLRHLNVHRTLYLSLVLTIFTSLNHDNNLTSHKSDHIRPGRRVK